MMRIVGTMSVLALAACGGTDHPELHLDLVVTPGSGLYLTVTEVDRPDATNQRPFAHPGECDETSDGWTCSGPCPGDWLGELSLEIDGDIVEEGLYDPPWGTGFSLDSELAGAILVIEDVEGAEVEVEIPDTAGPVPTIDDLSRADGEVVVTWSSAPNAASAVVELSGGFGGPRCHVDAGETATLEVGMGSEPMVYVHALAAPTTVTTAFGDVDIWIGGFIGAELPTP